MSSASPARAPRIRGARALFTRRTGGVGRGPYESLNLARHVGDDEDVVTRNRELLADAMGAPVVFVDQAHSAAVHVLRGSDRAGSGEVPLVTADALVTDRDDVALAIMVADCLPVLLSDGEAGVVAAVHAGRKGLLDGVLEAAVAAMVRLGARAARLEAAVGPSICGRCYEVPEQMREQAAQQLPAVRTLTRWGTPGIDLRAGAAQTLTRLGVPAAAIDAEHPCTLEDPSLFSYRREPVTGRFAGAIRRV